MPAANVDQGAAAVGRRADQPAWLDLAGLRPLCDLRPEVVSVMMPVEHEVELAPHRNEVHWREVRSALEAQGAPARVLEEIDAEIPTVHQRGAHLAAIGDGDGLALLEVWASGPSQEVATVQPVAQLGPVVAHRQDTPPYMLVTVDRGGADLSYVEHDVRRSAGSVGPERRVLHKIRDAGWSQRRIQQRADESWEHNARKVADVVDGWVKRFEPPVVMVAGDVRARSMLDHHVGEPARGRLVPIGGSRAEGAAPVDEHDMTQVLDRLVRNRTAASLERFRAEAGVAERACTGVPAVLDALRQHQVDTLLVALDTPWTRAWTSVGDPASAAEHADTLRDLGRHAPIEADAGQVALRAAIATGADICCVPSGQVPDGIGAILRWPEG